jgi:hypothetical protein
MGIQVNANGHWQDLSSYGGSLEGLTKKDFRVQVTLNSKTVDFGDKILAGTHELLVHAEEWGELINKLGDNPTQLASERERITNSNSQHREAFNGRNQEYEKANDEIESIITDDKELSKLISFSDPACENLSKKGCDVTDEYGTKGKGNFEESVNKVGGKTMLQDFKAARGHEKSYFNKITEGVYEGDKKK